MCTCVTTFLQLQFTQLMMHFCANYNRALLKEDTQCCEVLGSTVLVDEVNEKGIRECIGDYMLDFSILLGPYCQVLGVFCDHFHLIWSFHHPPTQLPNCWVYGFRYRAMEVPTKSSTGHNNLESNLPSGPLLTGCIKLG